MIISKDSLINQIKDAGFDVAGLIVPPDVFDHIAEELSEIAQQSEQGKVMLKNHPLVGMDIICDRKNTFDWKKLFAVMIDKNNHPVRLILRSEATAKLVH